MTAGSRVTDELGPALCLIVTIATLLSGAYYALFVLSKPTVYPNPGVEAYHLPAATRILPLPRVSDAPDVAIGEASPGGEPASSSTRQASAAPQPPAKEAAPPTHKAAHASQSASRRTFATQHWDNFASSQAWNSFGYVRQWDNSYRNNSSYRNNYSYRNNSYGGAPYNYGGIAHDAPARSRMGGGAKSPF
jgi:hypothetical protein